jgi:hypothetical protein
MVSMSAHSLTSILLSIRESAVDSLGGPSRAGPNFPFWWPAHGPIPQFPNGRALSAQPSPTKTNQASMDRQPKHAWLAGSSRPHLFLGPWGQLRFAMSRS